MAYNLGDIVGFPLSPTGTLSFLALDAYWIGRSDDNRLRFLIHVEAEYIRPRIVSHDIKIVIWLAVTAEHSIARFDVATQHFTAYQLLDAGSSPFGIVMAKDHTLWFTDSVGNKIGVLTP